MGNFLKEIVKTNNGMSMENITTLVFYNKQKYSSIIMVKYKDFHTHKNENLSPIEPYLKTTKIIYYGRKNTVLVGKGISERNKEHWRICKI